MTKFSSAPPSLWYQDAVLDERLPAYLLQQRWFGGKSRTLASATIGSTIVLADGAFALTTVDVTYTDGSKDVYQLPLAMALGSVAENLRTSASKASLADLREDGTDAIVYDASASEDFRQLLLTCINGAAVAPELSATVSPAADLSSLAEERSRVGSAEQSNTSLLFGQSAILKLFRRLQPGENPDVEICRFLTDIAHFKNIPAYLGELHRESDGATLAFLQEFAPNEGDGWAWFQKELLRYYESVARNPAPQSTGTVARFGEGEVSAQAGEYAGLSLEAAALLGRRTAEMHLALATPTDDPAFQAIFTATTDIAADSERLKRQTESALSALKRILPTLPGETATAAQALLARAVDLGSVAAPPRENAGFGQRIRIHGDYHLGQTLRSRNDFVLVDFEGEPAKPLEERRTKQSPLRDVAGMLRSFSYAARSALTHYAQRQSGQSATLLPWATLWENAISTRFLQEYTVVVRENPDLLPGNAQAQMLLARYLLEKALYELLYELNNRPDWVSIPLSGLLALLDAPSLQ